MITVLWMIPVLAAVALSSVLAGMRGYKRGHEDGVRVGVASVPVVSATSPVWSATDQGAYSYPVVCASYLLDEDGNIITSADRYLEPEAHDGR